MTTPDEPTAPSPRRRFLQRLLAAGGSVAAVSLTGSLVEESSAGVTGSGGGGRRSPLDEYLPDFSTGPTAGAIQTSIDAASAAGGGTVVLPADDYLLESDLRLPANVGLRGMSWSGTALQSADGEPRAIVVEDGAEGVSIESLTAPTIRFGAAASYCVLRRVRVLVAPSHAVELPADVAHHLSIEQVTIEGCGGDGIRHTASDAQGVFLSEVSITGFGSAVDDACGIRVGGRAHLSQIHVEPVGAGQTGVGFEAGSDYSTLTNYTMRLAGGRAVVVDPEDLTIAQGVGAVE